MSSNMEIDGPNTQDIIRLHNQKETRVEISRANALNSQTDNFARDNLEPLPSRSQQNAHLENTSGMEFQAAPNNSEETQPNPDGFFADTQNQAACSVRVALRVRPLVSKEMFEKQIVRAYPETNTVTIGADKVFTFDACFGQESNQEEVFDKCVKNLVLGCFQGFNATVLAYGQTGSGKTWTMGSGYTIGLSDEQYGIIPRVIRLIFHEVEKRKGKTEFTIKCSFLEIYNEELNDLLDHNSLTQAMAGGGRNDKINIREEKNGSIAVYGLREEKVENADELAACLNRGSNFRTTAATLMNGNSSRSHAIFTVSIEQQQIDELIQQKNPSYQSGEGLEKKGEEAPDEFMVAKFHFVDLAGSERAKKTGAVGATLKEGININKSLLVLGNVISALSDEGKKNNFVPYRDSKLTRILQDSLGGNSRTSMIACVSPAESNFDETLNTLNYASRARKIKNQPKVNRDPNSALIAELRQHCYEYQKECLRFRKLLVINEIEFKENLILPSEEELAAKEQSTNSQFGGPKALTGPSPSEYSGKEIRALEDEIKKLKIENIQKEKQNQSLVILNQGVQGQLNSQKIENYSILQQKDCLRLQLDQVNEVLSQMGLKDEVYRELQARRAIQSTEEENSDLNLFGLSQNILVEYQSKCLQLDKELNEKQLLLQQVQNDADSLLKQSEQDQRVMAKQAEDIEKFKRNLAKLQKENAAFAAELKIQAKNLKPGYPAPQGSVGKLAPQFGKPSGHGPEDFQHSFKRSFNMSGRQAEVAALDRRIGENLDFMSKDFEDKMKNFSDRFMETLTKSLTHQLGFDIKEAAEQKRRLTVGQSFIEKKSGDLGGLQFGRKDKTVTESFQVQASNNKPGKTSHVSASVLIPGIAHQNGNHRTPQHSQPLANANNTKIRAGQGLRLSMIQETETVNEGATVQDENVGSSDDEVNKKIPKNVRTGDKHKESTLTQEEAQDSLFESLLKRASILAGAGDVEAKQIRASQLAPENEEMHEEKHILEDAHQFEELAVQECSDESGEEDGRGGTLLLGGQEDVQEEELFAELDKREEEESRQLHDSIIVKLDGSLLEKEKLLAAIKASQNQMQADLLSLMKNQYHTKVLELTNEITQLEKQKAENLSKSGNQLSQKERKAIEDQFKQKQLLLEKQLREVADKNKQQQSVKKQVDQQNSQIKNLETEIQKLKVQKLSVQKKWKEETERHNKLRKEKADEILRMKKLNLKKDQEIDKLKAEAKRKEIANKRRQEEIKVLQTQKNLVVSKQQNASKQRKDKQDIDLDKIKDWIRTSIDKMIEVADAQLEIETQKKRLNEVSKDIDQELSHKASLGLLKNKLEVRKYTIDSMPLELQDQVELFNVDQEIEKIELEIEQCQQTVDSLSDKQDYIDAKISGITKHLNGINTEFAGSLGKQNLSSPEGIKALVDCFFQILQEASQELRKLQIERENQICEQEQLKEECRNQQNLLDANDKYYQAKIQNMENEYSQKELLLMQLIEENKIDQEEHRQNQAAGGQTNSNYFNQGRFGMQQKMISAKEEIQRQKEITINESKLFLSKQVAELERRNKEHEKLNFNLQNKLNQSLSEKEQLKLSIGQLRNQLKLTNEMSGDINLRSHIQAQYGTNQPQHQSVPTGFSAGNHGNTGSQGPQNRNRIGGLLAERRDQLKTQKNAAYKRDKPLIDLSSNKCPTQANPLQFSAKKDLLNGGNNTAREESDEIMVVDEQRCLVIPLEDDDQAQEEEKSSQMSLDRTGSDLSGAEDVQEVTVNRGEKQKNDMHQQNPAPARQKQRSYQNEAAQKQQTQQVSVNPAKKNDTVFERLAHNKQPLFSNRKNSEIQKPKGKKQATAVFGQIQQTMTHNSSSGALAPALRRQNTAKSNLGGSQGIGINPCRVADAVYPYREKHPDQIGLEQIDPNFVQDQMLTQANGTNLGPFYDCFNGQNQQNTFDQQAAWSIERVINNAHKQPISDLATIGNLLYSTSFKNLKIWDMTGWQIISDITAHQGVIKCVKAMHTSQNGETVGERIFATAGDMNDKTIHIWDMTTLTNISTLAGHKGEIRALEFSRDGKYLFSAGQGGMLIWDLRKMSESMPVDLIEKHQDIFSLKATSNFLFMGCRNHSIIPQVLRFHPNFSDYTLQPFNQAHRDVVTSFCTLLDDKILISASKDGTLRGWNTLYDKLAYAGSFVEQNQIGSEDFKQISNITIKQAHNDHINVIQQSKDQYECYSGSKDGVVNVWNLAEEVDSHPQGGYLEEEQYIQNLRLEKVASLQAQGSPVTAIAAADSSYGKMIVYGSQDKTLRICKGLDDQSQRQDY